MFGVLQGDNLGVPKLSVVGCSEEITLNPPKLSFLGYFQDITLVSQTYPLGGQEITLGVATLYSKTTPQLLSSRRGLRRSRHLP